MNKIKAFPLHPICAAFPRLSDKALDALAKDIFARGQRDKILLWKGQVIDGQNRQTACIAVGKEPEYQEFEGSEEEAIREAISRNALRRHLDESQRAMIAARLARLERGQKAGEDAAFDDDGKSANWRIYSAQEAAEAFNVSPRTIERARVVLGHGLPDLVARVDGGEMAVSAAARLADKPVPDQARALEAMLRGVKPVVAVRQAERDQKLRKLAGKATDWPTERFSVVYADPPWEWKTWAPSGEAKSPENHYPTMTLQEIQGLDVAGLAATDAVLFLWATVPGLPGALGILSAWGFTYKSLWGWDKVIPGHGYWGRGQLELLLIGTRGEIPAPLPSTLPPNLYREARDDHSAKPEWYARQIESFYPTLPKIELFRRGEPRTGWSAWGNEVATAEDGDGQ